ncbi:unnamed protein product [Lactuca saligna]|uniref:Uncharacterized protein n=1 Tax=Lactuca saligna TaxID=75948 RepID=A0AA35YQM4_LACSI|nr:unnamed protein product [Lactuca saligna]
MVLSFSFIMPPHQDPSIDVTPRSIHEQLSTLIAISTANVHRLDAIITQMATVNTLIDIQTGTMVKLIPPPPPQLANNQHLRYLATVLDTMFVNIAKQNQIPTNFVNTLLPTLQTTPPFPPLAPSAPQSSLPPLAPPNFSHSPHQYKNHFHYHHNRRHKKNLRASPTCHVHSTVQSTFFSLVALQTNLLDLEDEVNFKEEGIDMCLCPYHRPPPWPKWFVYLVGTWPTRCIRKSPTSPPIIMEASKCYMHIPFS